MTFGPFEECPLIVVYGSLSDGFSFYGPFAQQEDVDHFVKGIGLDMKYVEVKILDIPTPRGDRS